jgi:hypothetical protein
MESAQPSRNPVPGARSACGPDEPGPSGPGPNEPAGEPGPYEPGPYEPGTGAPGPGEPGTDEKGEPDLALPRIQVGSPADILAVVPHLMGFHPRQSFVVIGAAGPRRRVELGFRYDLPDPPGAAAAAEIADHAVAVLTERGASTVIGIGYGPGRLVTPVADALAAAARRRRLELRDLLRVEDGRYWSYLCANVACCPPDGIPFDYQSHPAAAAMTLAGLAAYPDRGAVEAGVAPPAGDAARAMEEAIDRACLRAQALVDRAQRHGPGAPLRLAISAGRRAVREAIGVYRGGGRITDTDRLAWLAVSLVHLAVRDDAWARMVPEHRRAHLALWADIVRRTDGPWVPAPASLLAFTAWQAGDGTLANVALDRALTADPDYSMARLLRDILAAGVPPSQARLPMTPEEVAESYAAQSPPPRAAGRPRARRAASRRGKRGPGPARRPAAPAEPAGPPEPVGPGEAGESPGRGRPGRAGEPPGPGEPTEPRGPGEPGGPGEDGG